MVCTNQVIVDGLRDSHKPDTASCFFCIAGKLAHSIHRIIAADIEEISDSVLFKLLKQFRIHFIAKILRKLISA